MLTRNGLIAATVAGLAINFAPSTTHAETDAAYVHLTMRVLSPLDGSWVDAGTFDVRGEDAAWEMPLTMQCRRHGAGEWYEAFTAQPKYDGSREDPKRVDSQGWAWYNWSYTVGFYPDGAIVNDGDQRGSAIDCRFGTYLDNDGFVPFTHFGQDGPQCLDDNPDDTLIQAFDRCAVAEDSVTLFVRCGKAGQSCCAGTDNLCDADLGCRDDRCSENPRPKDDPPPKMTPPTQPPPPPPPPPSGVWYEGLCECSDGFNFVNVGARACGDESAGPLDGFSLNAACVRFCDQIGGSLTMFTSLGAQPQLGSCDPSDGTWYPVN